VNPLEQLTLDDLRRRTSIKWTRYERDVLPLWVAEMDVSLAPPVRESLERAVRDGDTGYAGTGTFVEAFAGFAARRWSWDVDPGLVAPVSSVIEGFTHALILATDPGGEVVVNPPVYPPFFSHLKAVGRTIREAPLGSDMRLDLGALAHAFEAATAPAAPGGSRRRAGFLLCSPHNPGGTVHSREELVAVAALAEAHGVAVVADEIHAPLVYSDAEFTPYLDVSASAIALHAASKAFNLAAIPAALAVGGEDSGEWLERFRTEVHPWPTHFGAIAQAAAYASGDSWLDALISGLEANRDALERTVASDLPRVSLHHAQGTYLAWLDFSDAVDAAGAALGDDPSAALLERGRVALNPGLSFGTGGAGHARLNFATHPRILAEALERIASVVA
jgi:cystathionine beta-lyase